MNSFPWWQYARFGLACLVEWEGSQGTGLPAARKPWLPVQHREGWDRVSPNIHLSLEVSPQPATSFHVQQRHQPHLHIQKRSIHLHPHKTHHSRNSSISPTGTRSQTRRQKMDYAHSPNKRHARFDHSAISAFGSSILARHAIPDPSPLRHSRANHKASNYTAPHSYPSK